jgi:hypothetical protein
MNSKIILSLLAGLVLGVLLLLGGCYWFHHGAGYMGHGGMMGGNYNVHTNGIAEAGMGSGGMMSGGMMGVPIQGEAPVVEKNGALAKGYEQAKITCTQCHALPNPNLHTAEDWPAVFDRMKKHIAEFKKVNPNEAQWKSIVNYYQANAK